MIEWKNNRMIGWKNNRMIEWKDKRMNEWKDERMTEYKELPVNVCMGYTTGSVVATKLNPFNNRNIR